MLGNKKDKSWLVRQSWVMLVVIPAMGNFVYPGQWSSMGPRGLGKAMKAVGRMNGNSKQCSGPVAKVTRSADSLPSTMRTQLTVGDGTAYAPLTSKDRPQTDPNEARIGSSQAIKSHQLDNATAFSVIQLILSYYLFSGCFVRKAGAGRVLPRQATGKRPHQHGLGKASKR